MAMRQTRTKEQDRMGSVDLLFISLSQLRSISHINEVHTETDLIIASV